MALKRRNKIEAGFSMSSMTDIIFLLLLFFIITSTMTAPYDIKINLPQSNSETSTKEVVARISIDKNGNYFLGTEKNEDMQVSSEILEESLLELMVSDTATYIALYADKETAHKEVVNVLDIAKRNNIKLVIATAYKD